MHPGKAGCPSLVVKGQGQGWDIKFAFGHVGPWYWGVVAAGIRFARTRLGKPGMVASRRGEVRGALNPGGDGRKDKRTATVPEEPREESAPTPRPRASEEKGGPVHVPVRVPTVRPLAASACGSPRVLCPCRWVRLRMCTCPRDCASVPLLCVRTCVCVCVGARGLGGRQPGWRLGSGSPGPPSLSLS